MRLAFFSPLPPSPSGIADYSAELLELLAQRHSIDVFHAQDVVEQARLPSACRIEHVSAFAARRASVAYEVHVHQIGNSLAHAFVYEALRAAPGLLVLHDLVLHHARGRMFLEAPEVRAYRDDPSNAARRAAAQAPLRRYADEIAYSYPEQADRLERAQLGTVGDLLPYAYPLFRLPVEASRVVAAHNRAILHAVTDTVPGKPVVHIPMAAVLAPVGSEAVAALRQRYGFRAGDFVVASVGLLTREKRLDTLARAVARAAAVAPGIRLLLVGQVPDRAHLDRTLQRLGVAQITVVAGRVAFDELPAHIEAADAVVHLRYPTARETSAALLRVLAQGRPAIVSDLENWSDVPEDAVVRVDLTDEEGATARAIVRLQASGGERERLGRRAAEFVAREHSPLRCVEGYETALRLARDTLDPVPKAAWPRHWRAVSEASDASARVAGV